MRRKLGYLSICFLCQLVLLVLSSLRMLFLLPRAWFLTWKAEIIELRAEVDGGRSSVFEFVRILRPVSSDAADFSKLGHLGPVAAYTLWFLAVRQIALPLVLAQYGGASREYAWIYWITSLSLALADLCLIFYFCWRCFLEYDNCWRLIRHVLVISLAVLLSMQLLAAEGKFGLVWFMNINSRLRGLSLTLIALLCLLIYFAEAGDRELALLVAGMVFEFMGQAVLGRLVRLDQISLEFAQVSFVFLTLGKFLIWAYAVSPKRNMRSQGASG